MLPFGHIGITLASVSLGFGLRDKLRHGLTEDGVEEISPTRESHSSNDHPSSKTSFFRSLAKRMDIRFLLVGSLLPDIIDKPIGVYFFRETFSTGRIFSHTLLFLISITIIGFLIKKYSGKTGGLALSFGALFHLILDEMWLMPKTLLWPLFGIGFEKYEIGNWLMNMLHGLLENPKLYVSEMIGFVVLILFIWELLQRRAIIRFLGKGRFY